MSKENFYLKKLFNSALQHHKANNPQVAEKKYKKILKINPHHLNSIFLLGSLYCQIKNFNKAKQLLKQVIEINPSHVVAHNNLGISLSELNDCQKAKHCLEKAIELDPNYADAHNNLGNVFKKLNEPQKAMSCYKKVIEINPNHVEGHNNLGNSFNALGDCENAIKYLEKAIELNPNYGTAYNSLGVVFVDSGDRLKGRNCFEKAIMLNPNSITAIWNLHQFASNIDEALIILKKIINIDKNYIRAKAIISAIEGYKGNFKDFEVLLDSLDSNELKHPYVRSIKWVFSLPQLPKLFFNRWDFFDEIIKLTDQSRPFYEFGVWNGVSFQYLINIYKKGFGFDTFTGLPDSWREIAAGTYSSFGSVPRIKGGDFIVGKFEDKLPDFFSKKRPIASLINFDADLYSSTLCALNNTKDIMDKKTILVFDEFLINTKWEEDEFKALNEFCNNFNFSYDVLAVSFFSKQVAVKINKMKNFS